MSFSLPGGPDSLTGSGGFLSNFPAVRRQQLSRIKAYTQGKRNDARKTRALRKAQYKHKLELSKLSKDARDALVSNPLQHGIPRAFKVLLAGEDVSSDAKLHDIERFKDEDHFIHFAAFGIPDKPVRFNTTWIGKENIEVSQDRRVYTLKIESENDTTTHVHLDFTDINKPVGHIEIGEGFIAVALQPWAISFSVNVSANAGAQFSSGTSTLSWDEESPDWQKATWKQNNMTFSYDTVKVDNPFGGSSLVNEVSFQDPESNVVAEYTQADYGLKYTSLFQDITIKGQQYKACITKVNADSVNAAPAIRNADIIKSVFPELAIFKFDEMATSFTGAFTVPQSTGYPLVYSVVGTGIMPNQPVLAPGPVQPGNQSDLASNLHSLEAKSPLLKTSIRPTPNDFLLTGPDITTILPVTGLLNCDPMIPDLASSTGFSDSIAAIANKDFHDIICYHMDSDIHTTFVSATPTTLDDSTIQSIATDSADNAAFYKTLQVPYVTSSLGRSTMDEGKQCNSIRASAQLKTLPAESSIYKRHSDALYRHRFMQAFPSVQNYLDDQAKTDYSLNITNGAASMKDKITSMSLGVNGANSEDSAATLKEALDDIDSLAAWASSQKLFYAFNLYYWCETYYLPNLVAQSANGLISASVSRTMKKLTLMFGILENGQQNKDGRSFAEAFNELVRLFQMTTIIPQFVDADGIADDFDSIQKMMLQQFYTDNIGSSDPTVVAEAQRQQKLANDDFLRKKFFSALAESMRLGGSLGSWSAIVQLNQNFLTRENWFQNLAGAADSLSTFLRSCCVVLLIVPMLNGLDGGWSSMKPEQKTAWATTAASLGLTFFIKGLQGALRLKFFWGDLEGFVKCFKAFMGFKEALKDLGPVAEKTENAFARWLTRGSAETMEITGDEVTVAMKIFGRSAGEFLTNCVGAVLAGVNIVLSAIDLAKTDDSLQQTMDSLFIISSGLQLLAIAAQWLVTAGIATELTTISTLSTVAAASGPLAIVFAVAGLVVMIVMACLNKDPPNPVQKFLDDHASPAGLKMDHDTAIDYFNVVPSDKTAQSLNGISFGSQPFGLEAVSYIQLGDRLNQSTTGRTTTPGTSVTYLPDTCWNVKTDSKGLTMIWTYYVDDVGGQLPLFLGESSDGKVQALPPPPRSTKNSNGDDVPVDPTVYAQQLSMQQWTFQTKSAATTTTRTDGTDKIPFVTSAQFCLMRGDKHLDWHIQDDKTPTLILTQDEGPWNLLTSIWTLTLQSMCPSNFSYVHPIWQLNTAQRDEQNAVIFAGTTSSPLSWAISPALPSFLTLSPDDGTIKQTAGVAPLVTDAVIYDVTASITILTKVFTTKGNVTISVTKTPNSTEPATHLTSVVEKTDPAYSVTQLHEAIPKPGSAVATKSTSGLQAQSETSKSAALGRSMAELDPAPDLDTLQAEFDAFKMTAPPFFFWQQDSAIALNQHYTATMAISRMQNSIDGSWDTARSIFSARTQSFEDLYLPNRPAVPPLGPNDSLDYAGAAKAFVTQCIYNGDSYAQQYCNLNNTYNTISTFNQALWDTNTERYKDWLLSPSFTQNKCSLQDYQQLIENKNWMAYKKATQATGGWPNQSFEMYFHFLKLYCLGATQDQITEIYNNITGPNCLLAGGFSDITPSTWTKYTGYILSGPISYSQLGIQNLNRTGTCTMPGVDNGDATYITMHADTSFLQQTGYWQSPPSGCCFPADTQIVLADEKTSTAISTIVPGTKVLSSTRDDPLAVATVKALSKPRRDDRALYSFLDGCQDVKFTATHPIFLRYDEQNGLPVLGFVNVAEALSVNPLWAAFNLETIPATLLLQDVGSSPSGGTTGQDELLYDLVLEVTASRNNTSNVATFVASQAGSDKRLVVCSEAPDLTALPAMTRFVLALLQTIGSRPDTARVFADGLRCGNLDYLERIQKYRNAAASDISHQSSQFGRDINLDAALSVIGGSMNDAQAVMDASEAVVGSLGLGLQCHLDNGWQFSSLVSDATQPNSFVLSTHTITLAQASLLSLPTSLKQSATENIRSLSQKLLKTTNVQASFSLVGSGQRLEPASSQVACRSVGSHLHRVHSVQSCHFTESEESKLPWSQHYKLVMSMEDDNTVLVAEGCVMPDVAAMWPLRIEKLAQGGVVDGLVNWHVGWISVTGAVVLTSVLDTIDDWTSNDDEMGRIDLYAEILGAKVGEDILQTIF